MSFNFNLNVFNFFQILYTVQKAYFIIFLQQILYKRLLTAVEKNGSCTSAGMIKELDQVYEDCATITGQVDVLVQDLYPPLSVYDMEEQVSDRMIGTSYF